MSSRLEEFGPSVDVVLITFTVGPALDDYRRRNPLGFTTLTDPDRAAYRAFGLGRGTVARVWGWRALRRYAELLSGRSADGERASIRRPTEDTLQLGGDFVIGPDGTLVWGFWGDGPDDRPEVDALIAAVGSIPAGPADSDRPDIPQPD